MKRRRFVAASATAAFAVLAGCLTTADDQPDGETDDVLPAETRTVLDALPETVAGKSVETFWLVRPQSDPDRQNPASQFSGELDEELGISQDQADLMGVAMFDEFEWSVVVITGSFAGSEVTEPEMAATHVEDGFAIGAASQDGKPWQAGRDAAVEAADDPDAGLLDSTVETMIEPLADAELVSGTLRPQAGTVSGQIDDSITMVAFSQTSRDETTERIQYAAIFEAEASVSETALEDAIEATGQLSGADDIEFTQDGRRLTATFDRDIPPYRLPDDSPAASFTIQQDRIEQTGSEEVSPENLELRVDEEPVEPPWGDRTTPIEPGEQFAVDFDPFSFVQIYWLDPDRDGVEQPLAQDVVASDDPFSGEFDEEAGELTVTYTGDPAVDADRFELSRFDSQAGNAGDETPLSEFVGGTLTSGDSVTVTDLGYGDGVIVSIAVEGEQFGLTQSVFSYFVDPPGQFEFEFADGRLTVTYRGEDRPADEYRLRRGDEGTDRQFADAYDQLTDGDSIELDAELGDNFQVQWTGNDEPVVVEWYTAAPDVELAVAYDAEADEIEITHAGGETLDADSLGLRTYPQTAVEENPWAAEYDTVSEGDAVVVSVDGEETPDYVNILFEGSVIQSKEVKS